MTVRRTRLAFTTDPAAAGTHPITAAAFVRLAEACTAFEPGDRPGAAVIVAQLTDLQAQLHSATAAACTGLPADGIREPELSPVSYCDIRALPRALE